MNDSRNAIIDNFLDQNGIAGGKRSLIASDASKRRYERIKKDGKSFILMDAPPPLENVHPFVIMAQHLIKLGYSAPKVMAVDKEAGLLLLEDLGDNTYSAVIEKGGDEFALYELAVCLLIDIHKRPLSECTLPGLPSYGNGRLLNEVFLLPEWTFSAFGVAPANEETRRAYGQLWLKLFPQVHSGPKTLVLRDFHVDNLLWLNERSGIKACGILDFQDAVLGHPAYDLMSLLEDARRDLGLGIKEKMLDLYLSAFPNLDQKHFKNAFAILAAQRHAKVIGIFTRLGLQDKKVHYLSHLPRVWSLLEASLEIPILSDMKNWFNTNIPNSMRIIPKTPS